MKKAEHQAKQVMVAYNDYIPIAGRTDEAAAERAVAMAANQAAAAFAQGGRRPAMLPVRGDIAAVCRKVRQARPTVLINLCEAFGGRPDYEAHMAGLWEMLGIPFTGNSARALLLCQDKFQTKLLLRAAGVNVPDGWQAADAGDVPRSTGWPLIVKPVAEDGGIGIYDHSVVNNRADLVDRIRRICARYARPALVEKYIAGREFNVAVIERRGLEALPITEILFQKLPPGAPQLVGYNAKWRPQHICYRGTVPQCPARLPARAAEQMRQAALRAWTAAGLRGYARFDFRMDRRGRIYLLEINPNPDTSADAGLARALAAARITSQEFWRTQTQMALKADGGGR